MNKKNIIIIFILLSALTLIIFIVFNLNNNRYIELKTNNKNNISNDKDSLKTLEVNKYSNEDYKQGVNHNNVIFCENNKNCLKSLFINCIRGTDNFLDKSDKLNYSIIINNKTSNNDCNVSFVGADTKNKKYLSYCVIPVKEINDQLFDKILSKKDRESLKYCN